MNYTTGNAVVDQVGMMNFTGNIIPTTWYQTICRKEGKPYMNAIVILSDIVYWYRPKEVRDEDAGNIINYQKKFRADYLQRSYRQIMDQFSLSKKQAREALNFLCDLGVIRRHLRDDKTKDGMQLHNNMYIELVPERLRDLTYPQIDAEVVPFREPPCAIEGTTVAPCKTQGSALKDTTSTENTTEISTRDYNPIYMPDAMEQIEAYTQIIKENIEYEHLVQQYGRDQMNGIVDLLVETVSIEKEYVMIGGEKYPYQLVKGKLLKLDSSHIQYVMECMSKNTSKIHNIKNYLLTSLYNAPSTIDSYYSAEVNHDLYGI